MERAIYGTAEMAEGRERLIKFVLSVAYCYRGVSHARAGAFIVMRRKSCFRKIASNYPRERGHEFYSSLRV